MFKNILFDLDNTLYDYDNANKTAIMEIITIISDNFRIDNLKEEYEIEKKKFQNYCYNASSHNKFIQFKKIFEKLNIDLNKLPFYYNLYIDIFKKNLKLYPYILEFLNFCKQNGIKMYILTNNMCKEQIERLTKMNLLDYFTKIYTSEEFGIEKPDIKLFYYIIQDINCSKNEIVKIGDNYNNDIEPLILNDIYSFWFTNKNLSINKNYLQFNCYSNLLFLFKEYFSDLNDYLDISNYLGERFDLVQAGGGNTSFKSNGIMFIKSSGCSLSNMDVNKNYVGLNYSNIVHEIKTINSNEKKTRELQSKKIVESNIIFLKNYKPSIETTLHCLTQKYTIHIHPLQFNHISASNNCDVILKKIFKNYCLIDYFTPGIDVTMELLNKYNHENIIFLKNHGLVVTANSINKLKDLLYEIVTKLEKELNIDYSKYHNVSYISKNIKMKTFEKTITYLSHNAIIYNFIKDKRQIELDAYFKGFFPDKIVYCGIHYIFFKKKEDFENKLNDYIEKYQEIPKIIIQEQKEIKYLYISSNSLNKCKEIEDVLLSHLMCYKHDNIFLNEDETDYLNNWDAEKYRKNLN
tara:strand:- start:1834 stop:3564 length:1731 start_codon:yes stop_codon:yes gene_type:complete